MLGRAYALTGIVTHGAQRGRTIGFPTANIELQRSETAVPATGGYAVKVKVGDKVTNGTVIAVLEAMKMENDIVADRDGVVASINVTKGEAVETGAVVATLNA